MNNKKTTKRSLANTAIDWERKILKENGGYQDQVASAYGDFNNIIFSNNDFQVKKMHLNNSFIDKLISRILICYIPRKKLGINLSSSNKSEIKNIEVFA